MQVDSAFSTKMWIVDLLILAIHSGIMLLQTPRGEVTVRIALFTRVAHALNFLFCYGSQSDECLICRPSKKISSTRFEQGLAAISQSDL